MSSPVDEKQVALLELAGCLDSLEWKLHQARNVHAAGALAGHAGDVETVKLLSQWLAALPRLTVYVKTKGVGG